MLNIATPLQGKKLKNKSGKIDTAMKPTFGEDTGVTISDVLSQRYFDMQQNQIEDEKLQGLVNCFINKVIYYPIYYVLKLSAYFHSIYRKKINATKSAYFVNFLIPNLISLNRVILQSFGTGK